MTTNRARPVLMLVLVAGALTGVAAGSQAQQVARPAAPTAPLRPLAVQEAILPGGQSRLERVFELHSAFGDRDVLEITLGRAGVVRIQVSWRGSTETLAVILNGPGQTNTYARQDGRSPLTVEFEVTDDLLRLGRQWRVSVVNFSRQGRAVGRIVADVPTAVIPITRLAPVLRRIGEAATSTPPPASEPERSILENGQVQVRYPDGRVVIYNATCGSTTILPNGDAFSTQCNQVQPASLPALPSDPELRGFLEAHRDHLLDHISQLVEHRQADIDLYLAYESAEADGLFGQIQMRSRLIDRLLP